MTKDADQATTDEEDRVPENGRVSTREGLQCPDWKLLVPPPSLTHHPSEPCGRPDSGLKVTDIIVELDSSYCFTVHRGGNPVVTFCFEKLSYAFKAAHDMIAMLPRIARVISGRK